jgi:hypothetical protein
LQASAMQNASARSAAIKDGILASNAIRQGHLLQVARRSDCLGAVADIRNAWQAASVLWDNRAHQAGFHRYNPQ